jgi:hypothetical protein
LRSHDRVNSRYDDRLTTSYPRGQIPASPPSALHHARKPPAITEIASMKLTSCVAPLVVVGGTLALSAGHAETPEEWIKLGARVHGGFGAFIPAGIRIGLDALERLKAEPRGVTVTFYTGEKAPCPCIADGVMLATQASPGQGTLQVAAENAPPGLLAVVIVRDRKSGAGVRYSISNEWMSKIADWNKALDPAGRYAAVMAAPGLFDVAAAP